MHQRINTFMSTQMNNKLTRNKGKEEKNATGLNNEQTNNK